MIKRSRRKKRGRGRKAKKSLFQRLRLRLFVLFVVCFGIYSAYLDYLVRSQFEGKRWSIPASVYARPLEIYPGQDINQERLLTELQLLGYRPVANLSTPATYSSRGDAVSIHTRAFEYWDTSEQARRVRIEYAGERLNRIIDLSTRRSIPLLRFDPPLIGKIYPAHKEDRILVKLKEVPGRLVSALVSVEDRNFYNHIGIDPRAIARAVWVNLRAGSTVQGGSTLTQQLVKNYFLSSERTLWRKLNEAIMSLLLEIHYDKQEILEAYLNEVYLGQDGQRAIHGFGLASHFYFGRPLKDLKLPQVAMLVGMVRGASYYDPRRHPERARNRRNLVLDVMAEQGDISQRNLRPAKNSPLEVVPVPPGGISSVPAFTDLIRRQLFRDYRESDLTTEGLRIFTTLDVQAQRVAERALASRIKQLETSHQLPAGKLEGAVVVVDRNSGEVLAVVGGRRARYAGFNRALDAVRQIGSLIKPAVYLTALSQNNKYTLATLIRDEPITIKDKDGDWSPKNYDKAYHGDVPLFVALAQSYNVPTARLGLEVGLGSVQHTLRRLGVTRELNIYPSLLLGATALSPLEVTQMYQTLAGGGFMTPLRSIREVLAMDSKPLSRYPLAVKQVVDPKATYLVNTVLQEAVRIGTGKPLYQQVSSSLNIAGKTGTTDDLRDSWFAGFSGNYLAVVWLGMDDNSPSQLTGASGALRVWGDIIGRLDTQPLTLETPQGIEMVPINPYSGKRVDTDCRFARVLPFILNTAPQQAGICQGIDEHDQKQRGNPFDWFNKLFE